MCRWNKSLSGRKEMFYWTTHSTHFIYGYMASDIWLRTILIVRKETCCRHMGYSFRLAARLLLYAPSHWQDSTYHSLCYTSRGALTVKRNSLMGPPWGIDPMTHCTISGSSILLLKMFTFMMELLLIAVVLLFAIKKSVHSYGQEYFW